MSDRQNPPAFPVVASHQVYSHGMMLRDYFAAQALASVGTWIPVHGGANLGSKTAMMARALWAYEQADAMLAERAKERD